MLSSLKRFAKRLPPFRQLFAERDRLLAIVQQHYGMDCPPGHWGSPIPSLDDVLARQAVLFDTSARSLPAIDLNEAEQLALLETLAPLVADLPFTEEPAPPLRYYYANDWFRACDASVLCALLRHLRPKRLIEIGSGFSSAATLDTNERFLDGALACTFIEPFPGRLESLLTDRDRQTTTIVRRGVQEVELDVFDQLGAGDVLLIDSSHVSKIGSDVNHLVFAVLPRLRAGVVVHVHDITYPFEYDLATIRAGRYWNEAYLLRAFLQFNPAFEILLFNSYLSLVHPDRLHAAIPRARQAPGGSIWLRRR